MELPNKKYKVVYADPPWTYNNQKVGRYNYSTPKNINKGMISGACQKYNVMNIEEICDMPIKEISKKDSCLFLWIPTPLLEYGFKVMNAWGFKYKTAIFWRKIMSLGMGYWFRGQIEVCLFGIKGNIKAFHCQKPNFIQSKVREHSRKPDQLYGIIEELKLDPKIELFARQRREGWDCYGNELSDTIQKRLA